MKDRSVEIRTQSHDAVTSRTMLTPTTAARNDIAFNPSFLIDGIEAVSGDEVVLEMSDSCAQPWFTVLRTRDSATFSCRCAFSSAGDRRGSPRASIA